MTKKRLKVVRMRVMKMRRRKVRMRKRKKRRLRMREVAEMTKSNENKWRTKKAPMTMAEMKPSDH
jgi:hypothetical protein